jgi:hypothetical protein
MQLFAIYIGGSHEKSLIELHDMRFAIASCIEDTYEELRSSWWGTPSSLHLDAWGVVNNADGHRVSLRLTPPNPKQKKLYFVNLGGYDEREFTELHKNVFVVADDEEEAKNRAKEQISHWQSPHRDYLYEVENILNMGVIAAEKNLSLHLEETDQPEEFKFTTKYVPIANVQRR